MSIYGHTIPKHALLGQPIGRDYRVDKDTAVAIHRQYQNNPAGKLTEIAKEYNVPVEAVVTIVIGAVNEGQ